MSATVMQSTNRGMPRAEMAPDRVLVLGVGNLLVGDEGVGMHVVQQLRKQSWPEHVEIVEGGNGGFRLLELIQSAPRVILIDAARDGLWPGSVTHFRLQDPADFPPALGAHDIGLKALLTAAALIGEMPEIEVITISVDEVKSTDEELTEDVAAALPEVRRIVRRLVD